MASFKVGSKSEVFHLSGHTWLCSTGLKPDVMIQVQDQTFHLHKFPLLSRSGYLETLFSKASESTCVAQLHDIPGGPDTFLLVAKFCYGARIEITAENVVSLRCAAEYLQMSENYGDANLIYLTESFLNDNVFTNWDDSIKALESCEHKLIPLAEELHIVTRCISSLAIKASYAEDATTSWNGIQTKSTSGNWWFNDVSSSLDISMYKRFIKTIESRGVKAGIIAASVTHYAKRSLPLLGSSRHCGSSYSEEGTNHGDDGIYYSHEDQRSLLEEIVKLLPSEKCVTSIRFLLRLLRTSMVLRASAVTQENLERKIGVQLDEAALEDVLIPNMGNSAETLYDIDSFQRILDHFMLTCDSSCYNNVGEKQIMVDDHSLMPITKVASLIDGYLAEVASDENLKLSKFQALGALVPEDVRPMDDGIYRAIDIYIKAHPWLTKSEREQLCMLMNCQKLSLEASSHAAQNERLPLRVIVQVLFIEQMRLRTSISGWFFDTDSNNDDTSGKSHTLEGDSGNANMVMNETMKERVYELEKECTSMKQDLDKLVKTKEGRSFFSKLFGLRSKTKTSPGDEDGVRKE
ncbi:PREDICTED: putative BTB/POZ domain-containing protein At5g13600 [Brassica oleracea var. oleracea]|uniref:NPH3 domain-containing protein n=1 Tax=Brassica oleracea var. oleracea TaxID=109376 RepID=A0A0D3AIV7_BRAOL|nr:PREDICTED: putative BTB/POZ domain-containing protein At5g13600 [Brassica oleracea var. oleracea]